MTSADRSSTAGKYAALRLTVVMFASRLLVVELGEAGDVAALLAERAHHADPRQRLLQVAGDRGDPLAREPVGVGRGDPEDERADRQDREAPGTSAAPGAASSTNRITTDADQRQRRTGTASRSRRSTSWSSASTSLVSREMSTPARLRE